MQNNSPYLWSSLQIRIERDFNPKTTLVLCLHSNNGLHSNSLLYTLPIASEKLPPKPSRSTPSLFPLIPFPLSQLLSPNYPLVP